MIARRVVFTAILWLLAKNIAAQTLPPLETLTRLAPAHVKQAGTVSPEVLRSPGARRLTLGDLERIALSRSPALNRAAAGIEAVRGKWLQAGLAPDPSLAVGQQQLGSQGRAEQDFVAISQEIVLGGKLRLDRTIAAKELARAEIELAAQQMRVQSDVRIAFYSSLVAQRQRGVADELVRIAHNGVTAAQEAAKGTPIGSNDVLEARIELRTAEIEARSSYQRHLATWRRLTAVIADPGLPLQELDGDLRLPESERGWDELLARLEANSPELASAMVNLEMAQLVFARAAVEKVPNVTVNALVNWRDNGIGGDPDGGLQVSFPLPIWNRNRGTVAQTAAEVALAEQEIERLRLDLQRRLSDVFERYAAAYFQARSYRDEILPAAQQALELTSRNYRAGEVDYNDLLTSQRTNVNANLTYLTALRDLLVAEAELDGLLLTGSLDARD